MRSLYNNIGIPYNIGNLVMRRLTSIQNYIDIYIIEDAKSKYQFYKDIDKEEIKFKTQIQETVSAFGDQQHKAASSCI